MNSDMGNYTSAECKLCGEYVELDLGYSDVGAKHQLLRHLVHEHPNIGNRIEKKLFTDESKATENDHEELQKMEKELVDKISNMTVISDSSVYEEQQLKDLLEAIRSMLNDVDNWTFTGDWAGTSQSLQGIKTILGESDFKEDEHPREDDGKFTSKGGGSSSSNGDDKEEDIDDGHTEEENKKYYDEITQNTLETLNRSKVNGFPFFSYIGKPKEIYKDGKGGVILFGMKRNPNSIRKIDIKYDEGRDTYSVSFTSNRNKPKGEYHDIYFDQLSDLIVGKSGLGVESIAKEDFWVDPAGYSHTEREVERGAKDTWNMQDADALQELRYLRGEDDFDDERIRRIKRDNEPYSKPDATWEEWMGEDAWKSQDFGWQSGGESIATEVDNSMDLGLLSGGIPEVNATNNEQCEICGQLIDQNLMDYHVEQEHGLHVPSQYTQDTISQSMGDPNYDHLEDWRTSYGESKKIANEVNYDYNEIKGGGTWVEYHGYDGRTGKPDGSVKKGKAWLKGPAGWVVGDGSSNADFVDESNFISSESKANEYERIRYDDYGNPINDDDEEESNWRDLGIEAGDYVDFGSYGKLYVTQVNWSGMGSADKMWATDLEEERYNRNAEGWNVNSSDAVSIISKGTQQMYRESKASEYDAMKDVSFKEGGHYGQAGYCPICDWKTTEEDWLTDIEIHLSEGHGISDNDDRDVILRRAFESEGEDEPEYYDDIPEEKFPTDFKLEDVKEEDVVVESSEDDYEWEEDYKKFGDYEEDDDYDYAVRSADPNPKSKGSNTGTSKAEEAFNRGASAEEIYTLVDTKESEDGRTESEDDYLNNLYNKTTANRSAGFIDI